MTDAPVHTVPRITRAGRRAPDPSPEPLSVAVASVRVPAGAGERRNPMVLVDAEIGPMKVTFAVVTRKRRRLAVLAPEAADRTEGIRLPPVLQEVVHEAVMTAAKADPAAHQVLMRREDAGA